MCPDSTCRRRLTGQWTSPVWILGTPQRWTCSFGPSAFGKSVKCVQQLSQTRLVGSQAQRCGQELCQFPTQFHCFTQAVGRASRLAGRRLCRASADWSARARPESADCQAAGDRRLRAKPVRLVAETVQRPRHAPFRGSGQFPGVPYSSQKRRWGSFTRVLTPHAVPGHPGYTVGQTGDILVRFPIVCHNRPIGPRNGTSRGTRGTAQL